VFKNGVLRKIVGPKRRAEVAGGWGKWHDEKFHNLYSLSSIVWVIRSRRVRWSGHGVKRNAYRILVGKAEGRTPRGRPRCRR
jgi:hypothetical protein